MLWRNDTLVAYAIVLMLLSVATSRADTMYLCKEANGSVSYSDVPCGSGAQRVERQPSVGSETTSRPVTLTDKIEITSVRYVSPRNGRALDVTAKVQAGCGSFSCPVHCGNLLAGDPDLGQRKLCTITYRCSSAVPHELHILEGETATLSCQPASQTDRLVSGHIAGSSSEQDAQALGQSDTPATAPSGARASDSDIAELQNDLTRLLGGSELKTPAALVGNVVHNIAPADPQWTPANPRYVAMFNVVQADLDQDLGPMLRQQRAAGEQLLRSALASHLSNSQVVQLLQFFRTPTGAHYITFQQRLNGIVSQGLSQAMLAVITGGGGGPAAPDLGSPELLAERIAVLKLSYFTLLLHSSSTPSSAAARTETSQPDEDRATFVLSAVAGIRGPEIDQLRVAYRADLERFTAFHQNAASKALFAMFRAPDVPKQFAGSVTPGALQEALQSSVAMHSPLWKAGYEHGRDNHAASPSTSTLAATVPPASRPEMNGDLPREPEVQLPVLKTIPSGDEIVLEVGPTTGPEQDDKMRYRAGIRIFDLTRAQAYQWDLPDDVLDGIAPQSVQRASWSPATNELLFAKLDQAYLISKTGQARPLNMQMPGKLKPFDGVETPALSPDGRFISYYLYTRDAGDRQPDGFGRLYVDLMYQSTQGSQPVSLMREVRPSALAWSPDGERLACGTYDGRLIVLDRSGRQTVIHTGAIYTLRWSPDGTQIGFVNEGAMRSRANSGLYVVHPDGTELRRIRFASPDVDLKSFSWSPDGRRLVFRSYFEGTKICNYSAIGYKVNTGDFPCINGSNLFTSDADGTNLKKISPKPDYSQGELFWIQ